MQDLHLPSASTTTRDAPSSSAPVSARLSSLLSRRSNLESVLSVHYSTLSTNSSSTMNTPLVDPQGFPRSDIDVAGVRNARVQIIRLRNDLDQLENELHKVVQEGFKRGEEQTTSIQENKDVDKVKVPFAKANSVARDSPAQLAGLEPNDLIISISSIDSTNHENLVRVGKIVSESEGKSLPVVVQREGGKRQVLRLVPKSGWGGRGLLGCHIVPYP
ncbi:hypothetical protein JCM16303_006135 [Sporobolomyces ruberrimus]